jgi:hypothetical protein
MQLINIDGVGKVWIFIVFQYIIILAMGIFSMVIKDVPEQVSFLSFCFNLRYSSYRLGVHPIRKTRIPQQSGK